VPKRGQRRTVTLFEAKPYNPVGAFVTPTSGHQERGFRTDQKRNEGKREGRKTERMKGEPKSVTTPLSTVISQ